MSLPLTDGCALALPGLRVKQQPSSVPVETGSQTACSTLVYLNILKNIIIDPFRSSKFVATCLWLSRHA